MIERQVKELTRGPSSIPPSLLTDGRCLPFFLTLWLSTVSHIFPSVIFCLWYCGIMVLWYILQYHLYIISSSIILSLLSKGLFPTVWELPRGYSPFSLFSHKVKKNGNLLWEDRVLFSLAYLRFAHCVDPLSIIYLSMNISFRLLYNNPSQVWSPSCFFITLLTPFYMQSYDNRPQLQVPVAYSLLRYIFPGKPSAFCFKMGIPINIQLNSLHYVSWSSWTQHRKRL